jgi:hypothetical protein
MLRASLSILAVMAVVPAAQAADLPPTHSRLGAVFAKPYDAKPRQEIYSYDYPMFVFAPQVDIQPFINGYYGKPNSYYYRPYYGHALDTYTRLPYACGFFGYC